LLLSLSYVRSTENNSQNNQGARLKMGIRGVQIVVIENVCPEVPDEF
jgi:hypothetical protein